MFLTFKQFINESEKFDELHHELLQHYTKYTPEHIHHLDNYQEGSEINHYLMKRHYNKRNNPPNKYFETEKKYLDSATKTHITPKSFHTYRGLNYRPNIGLHHSIGYMSTTLEKHIAANFAAKKQNSPNNHHILHIHIPKNHPGAYINNPKYGTKQNNSMREFILPRNTHIHIHPNPTIENHPTNPKIKLHLWHATIHQ